MFEGRIAGLFYKATVEMNMGLSTLADCVVAAMYSSGAAFSDRTATDTPGNAKRRVRTCMTFGDMSNSKVNR